MRITVLDKCTLIVGDMDFSGIDSLGSTEYYDILTKEQIIDVCAHTEVLLCNKAVIDRDVIERCKSLRYIGLFATGYNNVDTACAAERGIVVVNVPGYSTSSVAQLTFAFILQLATSLGEYNKSVHSGEWIRSYTFSYFPYPITELSGKTLGIFGFGAIGQAVARIADAFCMKVIVCSRTERPDAGYEFVSRGELFRRSDYLTLHAPLNPDTERVVCAETLSLMKKTACIINTSRGGVIDEDALCEALNSGRLAGAALDVLTYEPMSADNALLTAKNCILTPHVAWASVEARRRLIELVCENIKAYRSGTPVNVVN